MPTSRRSSHPAKPEPAPAQAPAVPLKPLREKIGEDRDNLAARGRAWTQRRGRPVK